jgi:hypothetical protein
MVSDVTEPLDATFTAPTKQAPATKLDLLADWATQNGVAHQLALVLHACDARELFQVSAVLQFLVLPSAVAVMRDWLSAESDWTDLVTLSDHLLAAPHILTLFPPLPRGKQLGKQWKGKVSTSRIPLCLASRHPPRQLGLSVFFEQLRVWLVIQGFKRSRESHPRMEGHDVRIRDVADRLRLGAERQRSRQVLEWIQELQCAPEDDEALSRLLIWRTGESKATGDRRSFFLKLCAIAENEHRPSKQGEEERPPALERLHAWADAHRPVSSQDVAEAPDATQLSADPDELPEDVAGSPWVTRVQSGRGLRILSVEALQFLPWSWHVPTPFEQSKLWTMLGRWHASNDPALQALAFQTHVAILTSRSLTQAEHLRISVEPQEDWTLSPDGGTLHRLPPRPVERVKAQPSWMNLLRPLATSMRFDISKLRPSVSVWPSNPKSLQEVWHRVSPEQSARALFSQECAADRDLLRLTSRSLEYVFAAKIYEASRDGVLAQLLSSGYRTAFGGNCAYPSWTIAAVRRACLTVPCTFEVIGPDGANGAGSELDPRDEELRKRIVTAANRIGHLAREPHSWIAHHNAVTTYVLAALFASTGARPVTDPFESPSDFDWDRQRVFVTDKVSPGHAGRLIPLPERAYKLLLHYRAHLAVLAGHLPAPARLLKDEIEQLAAGKPSRRLPFFFFLREDTFGWYSVSEATLNAQGAFEWTLPWNVMRHRLAIRLRSAKVDPELVDALLGHADRGVLTHGDYSVRCWKADMDELAPALAATYDALGFRSTLSFARVVQFDSRLAVDTEQLMQDEAFGNHRREIRRRRELHKQWHIVFRLYQKALNRRKPEELDSNEWASLVKEVRTRDGIHPHPHAVWRYNRLRDFLGCIARVRPLRLGRAFAAEREMRPAFRASAIGCEKKLRVLRVWFAGAPCHPQLSKLRVSELVALAVLDIVLYSRVTYWPLLRDVLSRRNCRMVVKDGKTFVEHHRMLDGDDEAPVQRFRVSLRCAAWLDAALSARPLETERYALRSRWRSKWPVAELGPPPTDSIQLVKFVAEIVEQANFIEMPGLLAGYRAGRVTSNALPHATWLLEEDGLVLHDSPDSTKTPTHTQPPTLSKALSHWVAPKEGVDRAQAAHRMVENVRLALESFEKGRREPEHRMSRDEVADAIRSAVSRENGALSSALWCFGTWLDHLAKRDGRTGEALVPATIARYLNSLCARFLHIGNEFDLLKADGPAIADFYERLLNHHREMDIRYVANRLRDFDAFLKTYHGTCSVDWGGIDCGQIIAHSSPGLVGSLQYQNALRYLVPDPAAGSGERLAAAFLLLLSYRFGLRCADGAWIRSRDWHKLAPEHPAESHHVVSVQQYWRRSTKAPMTRRTVPQLEAWDPFETEVVSHFCAPTAELRRQDPNFALFAKDRAGNMHDPDRLEMLINEALSASHGGARVTEHKLRHGFADRIGCALMSRHLRPHSKDAHGTAEASQRITLALLGTVGPTRRVAFAFSRAMGHAGPPVTFGSYFHRLGAWSDEWNEHHLDGLDRARGSVQLKNAVDLDQSSRAPWRPAAPVQQNEPRPASMEAIVAYIQLLRAGCSSRVAAQHAGISHSTADRAERLLRLITDRLNGRRAAARDRRHSVCLARDLDQTEWQLLEARCDGIDAGRVSDGAPTPDWVEEAAGLVSDDRQLLMWREDHCRWMARFMAAFKLGADDLTLICVKGAGPDIRGWMKDAGLSEVLTVVPSPAMRIGRPPPLVIDGMRVRITDRAALMARTEGASPRIRGRGLVLLWILFVVYLAERARFG